MNGENQRIYGKEIDIDADSVKTFWDKRALLVEEKGWGTVNLGDQDSTIGEKMYKYESEKIMPRLGIGKDTRVLDLGCGMGRWAKMVLPYCGFYCGIDFSEELIKIAKKLCKADSKHGVFHSMPVTEAVNQPASFFGGTFNCIIIAGLCIGVNDNDLRTLFDNLSGLCGTECVIYIKETAAFDKRLTLSNFESKELKSSYNAIYRTPGEYESLFKPLFSEGFFVSESFFFPEELGRKREETNAWCTILKRR